MRQQDSGRSKPGQIPRNAYFSSTPASANALSPERRSTIQSPDGKQYEDLDEARNAKRQLVAGYFK